MDNKVRVGVVGLRRGRDLLHNMLFMPEVSVSVICDKDKERLKSCEEWLKYEKRMDGFVCLDNFEDVLNTDIDAVVIATEVSAHVPMSIQALEAGKHVLSEVPAINTLEEAKNLYKAVKKTNLKYMLGENCCFWAFVNTWKEIYESGRLGDVWYAEAEYLHNVVELMKDKDGNPTWRASYDAIKYLTHDLGPLLYILDDRCVSVSGFAPDINPIPEASTGTPNEIAIFKTEKGALIKIFVSFGLQREPARHNFCMYGSKGTLETTRSGEYATLAYFKDIPHTQDLIKIPVGISYPGTSERIIGGHGGADYFMLKSFIKSIIEDTEPPINVDLAIRMSIPGIYAHMSVLNGSKPMEIPNFDEEG
ncbi:MAG TPA: Gfo/Idh/MocA family oxidoreductase [Clostridiaceae bacterium]|nr:Gfo/Idh/MocA family oxidoreductase [Clostridiaceae bacterium]